MTSTSSTTPSRLHDYKQHYRADADYIEDPGSLSHIRSASERRRLQVIVNRLRLRRDMRVLDVGCGSGWLSDLCAGRGAQVVACDIAPSGVASARGRYPNAASYLATDVYAVGLAEASFDAVVLSEVVE
ncbi:MAG: class I SAM-dependent methyltransferase, partial [Candidatus Latescibacterota bacterium]|nr:class I SAM-dependent methyltransferase [Candidatus Latescibacterota bacterium]